MPYTGEGKDHPDPLKLVTGQVLLRELRLLTNNIHKTLLVICPHFLLVSGSFICSSVHWRENEQNVVSCSGELLVPSCLVHEILEFCLKICRTGMQVRMHVHFKGLYVFSF